MTSNVVCHLPQNIILNVGDLQSDVVFQGFYGAWSVPLHSLLQEAPKYKRWRSQMWQSRKLQVLWNDSVSQWSNDPCSENECHSSTYVQNVESYSCTVPAWTSNAPEASLIIQELWAKMIQAFYIHHLTKGKRQSDNNHSNPIEGEVLQYVWRHVKSVPPSTGLQQLSSNLLSV